MIKIPMLTFEEVSTDDFRAECLARFLPKQKPAFGIGDVVEVEGDFGRKLPGTIIQVTSSASDSPWRYDVARPRLADGVLERVIGLQDSRLTLIDAQQAAELIQE